MWGHPTARLGAAAPENENPALSPGNSVLINAYLLELTTRTELHCHHIDAPGPICTAMEVEIGAGYLQQLALFVECHRFFGTTIEGPPARFYFYENKIVLVFGYEIDLTIATTKVALQDTVSPAYQCFCCQALTCSTQSLACSLYVLMLTGASRAVFDENYPSITEYGPA